MGHCCLIYNAWKNLRRNYTSNSVTVAWWIVTWWYWVCVSIWSIACLAYHPQVVHQAGTMLPDLWGLARELSGSYVLAAVQLLYSRNYRVYGIEQQCGRKLGIKHMQHRACSYIFNIFLLYVCQLGKNRQLLLCNFFNILKTFFKLSKKILLTRLDVILMNVAVKSVSMFKNAQHCY